MNTGTKVVLVLGVLLLFGGVVAFALGVSTAGDIEENVENFDFAAENQTSGTIYIEDNDDVGDIGVTFYVKGTYTDDNDNQIWDVCENTQITITAVPNVNPDWEGAEEHNGGFYSEVVYNYSGGDESDCAVDDRNKDTSRSNDGLVKVGRACYACYAGDLTFESNVSVWVIYDDKVLEGVLEDVVGFLAGSALGFLGVCCGVIFLVIGITMAFTIKGQPDHQLMLQQQQMMQQQPKMQGPSPYSESNQGHLPTRTHMSQPDFKKPGGGL